MGRFHIRGVLLDDCLAHGAEEVHQPEISNLGYRVTRLGGHKSRSEMGIRQATRRLSSSEKRGLPGLKPRQALNIIGCPLVYAGRAAKVV